MSGLWKELEEAKKRNIELVKLCVNALVVIKSQEAEIDHLQAVLHERWQRTLALTKLLIEKEERTKVRPRG